MSFNFLILGASYGSLLASKLLMAGHAISLVCRPTNAELINREGIRTRITVKGFSALIEIDSRRLPGPLSAAGPHEVNPADFDLVVLAMKEPQYGAPDVRTLMRAIGAAAVPCLSLMNIPPLPYLARIPGVPVDDCRKCFSEPAVWDGFDPELMTLCSPDPQAFRPAGEQANVLQVGLPSNFKSAPFGTAAPTAMLRQMEADIENARYDAGDGPMQMPVKLKVHDSVFVPLAKWSMLLAGNYRCVHAGGIRSIERAVHGEPDIARQVYEWTYELCKTLGAKDSDLVPFDKYAAAARSLINPSSEARAVYGGSTDVERADLLVQTIAAAHGRRHPAVDQTVALIDAKLHANRVPV
jgi:hypothetical protein